MSEKARELAEKVYGFGYLDADTAEIDAAIAPLLSAVDVLLDLAPIQADYPNEVEAVRKALEGWKR